MRVLIRIQKIYKNLTKRSSSISWADGQPQATLISSPTHEEDLEKRMRMTLIISYLALILNLTTAVSTIYFLLNEFSSKWILYLQSVYWDCVNNHRETTGTFSTRLSIFRGQPYRQHNSYNLLIIEIICHVTSSSISFLNFVYPLMCVPDRKIIEFDISFFLMDFHTGL